MYKVLGADLHCPMFSLQAANQFYQPLFSNSPSAILFPSAILPPAISLQPKTPHPKASHQKVSCPPFFFFSKSFMSRGKQSGVAVLWEGCDIVTRGICFPASLNINNLGKAVKLHLTFLLSSAAGAVPNLSLQII
jgi:hypothetical protein